MVSVDKDGKAVSAKGAAVPPSIIEAIKNAANVTKVNSL